MPSSHHLSPVTTLFLSMDDETLQMLRDLPGDLKGRGWELSLPDSRVQSTQAMSWCKAVYIRLFDDRLDSLRGTWAIYDRQSRQRIMRVSTHQDRSASWDDALQDAIRRMREVDVRHSRAR